MKLQHVVHDYRHLFCSTGPLNVRRVYQRNAQKHQFIFLSVNKQLEERKNESYNLLPLTQHFEVKVAARLASCIVRHAGVASCVIDLCLDNFHSGVEVLESEVSVWIHRLPFFEPGHGGCWRPISDTQQGSQVSSDHSHVLCASCSIQTRRD